MKKIIAHFQCKYMKGFYKSLVCKIADKATADQKIRYSIFCIFPKENDLADLIYA